MVKLDFTLVKHPMWGIHRNRQIIHFNIFKINISIKWLTKSYCFQPHIFNHRGGSSVSAHEELLSPSFPLKSQPVSPQIDSRESVRLTPSMRAIFTNQCFWAEEREWKRGLSSLITYQTPACESGRGKEGVGVWVRSMLLEWQPKYGLK